MTISICIPTFNQAQYLSRAVDSALSQTFEAGCEVIVSDDASTDGTAVVMEAYKDDPRVRYYRQAENLGISGNTAFAFRQSKGELVIRLDSDDFLSPDFAAALAKEFGRHPKMGIGHVMVSEVDEHGKGRRLRSLSRPTGFQEGEEAFRAAHLGYKVAANICMFRRSALEDVGYYREGMNFAEDWDLWARLADAGWGNFYLSRTLASYRVWTDAGGYREGRKVAELLGILQVFERTLVPSYLRRGWEPGCLDRKRKAIARNHVRALTGIPRHSADYRNVVVLLRKLGGSPLLSLRLWMVGMGLGAYLNWMAAIEIAMRDGVKRILFRKH